MEILGDQEGQKSLAKVLRKCIRILDQCRENYCFKLPQISQNIKVRNINVLKTDTGTLLTARQ
ncbi:hypothetical protein LguiA_034044 [Lonicera macranthoides]